MGMRPSQAVYLVEDDADVRQSLIAILAGRGIPVQAFDRGEALLSALSPESCGCLILDLVLPGANAIELMRAVRARGCQLPFLIITGHGDVPTAVTAMQEGAVDYLVKPVAPEQLLDRIERAFEICQRQFEERAAQAGIERRLASLTRREREVLDRVVAGKMTREIASELGISPKTVEVHRSHITRKMHVGSVVQLVRMVAEFRLRCGDAGDAPLNGSQ